MENNEKEKIINQKNHSKMKEIGIAIGVCSAVLIGIILLSIGMYKIFYNSNKITVDTLADNNYENYEDLTQNDEIQIELIDPESIQDEDTEENKENVKQEELSEEEKQKLEQQRKKQEEERKKQAEEKRKSDSQKYPYYIKVNYLANTVTIYGKDGNGNYTVPVKAMVCSTGKSTPRSGVYKTPQKAEWGNLIGSYGQYCTRITGQILFHSVPYWVKYDKTSLEYDEYDRLGEARSLGCIRLTVIDAKWIFDNCPLGTSVEFYASSDPGPLGKPSAPKISGYDEPYKNWDPTDPDPNNPWRNYDAHQAQKKAEEEARKAEEARRAEEARMAEEARRAEEARQAEEARRAEEERRAAEEEAQREEQKRQEELRNQVVVPNLIGKTEEIARNELSMLELNVTVIYEDQADKSDGIVIRQDPISGNTVTKGSYVQIIVNKKNNSI